MLSIIKSEWKKQRLDPPPPHQNFVLHALDKMNVKDSSTKWSPTCWTSLLHFVSQSSLHPEPVAAAQQSCSP